LFQYATIFKRVLDTIRIKIRHLKGENKLESSGRLDSNGLDIRGLKAAERNELIVTQVVPRQNLFSSKRRLIPCQQLINEAYISSLGLPETFL